MKYKELYNYFGSVVIKLKSYVYDIGWSSVSILKGYDDGQPIYEYIHNKEIDEHLVVRLCFNLGVK